MNKVLRHISFLFCMLFISQSVYAQQVDKTEQEKKNKTVLEHSPKKALFLALALPGAGQVYNQKYWKLPIVYGGLGISTYFIVFNHNKFKDFDKALKIRQDGGDDEYKDIYSENALESLTLDYRNERDRAILITAGLYLLQVVDAYVDAHLFNFDISDDLSLNVNPMFNYDLNTESVQTGISLNFSLR